MLCVGSGKGDRTRIGGCRAQVMFDSQKLVVFGGTLSSARCSGFDLPATNGDRQIGDGGIFGFTGAVADDIGIAVITGGKGLQQASRSVSRSDSV